jgi:hypothetical protein
MTGDALTVRVGGACRVGSVGVGCGRGEIKKHFCARGARYSKLDGRPRLGWADHISRQFDPWVRPPMGTRPEWVGYGRQCSPMGTIHGQPD